MKIFMKKYILMAWDAWSQRSSFHGVSVFLPFMIGLDWTLETCQAILRKAALEPRA